MQKFYKLATLLIVLCLCFAVTGCFGSKPKEESKQTHTKATTQSKDNYLETISDTEKQNIITSCKSNEKNIGIACEMYAADHNGRYPKNLDELTQNGYIRIIPTCPLDSSSSYKFVSKSEPTDYYILKCPNHKIIFESQVGLLDNESTDLEGSIKDYYEGLLNGKSDVGEGKVITLTDDDLKELGFK